MVAYHTYLRAAFQRELLPSAALWLMAADATAVWLRSVEKVLTGELGDRAQARAMLTEAAKPVFERRYAVLATEHGWLPNPEEEPRAVPTLLSGFYPTPSARRVAWLLDGVGGPPRGTERWRAFQWARRFDNLQRWHEASTHLGELLIVLTEELPKLGLVRTNAVLGRLCFRAGSRYAEQMKRALQLPETPASAIEVLRMGEYIFRVNPEHEHGSDATTNTGFIEGNACPWYSRPGWGGAHCGIFGQFQNGISHAFGLRYQLTKTIPRHGGQTCRIELRPIKLRRSRDATDRPPASPLQG